VRPLSPGDVIAGKFRLERVIGRGGMGSVWAARHAQLDMPVALKFIELPEGGSDQDVADARARFDREARAIAQIRSPHVVQILDHGVDGDRPFIVMELLEGEDLGERLRREGRISLAVAARIATQAAKALRRAHEAGIIHRDLKPGNIFLARFDDEEVVKVLDFGVAKMVRSGAIEDGVATQVGVVFGSPSYMSPEQARGVRALDHRTDLWSLAVILYRAVTGVKPFQATTIADMVIKLCIDPLPIPSRDAPDLPPAIDRFFERAFARDPDKRFPTAAELAAAFEAAALVTSAPPASTPTPPPPPSMRAPSEQPPASTGPHVAFAPGTLTPPPSTNEVPQAPAYPAPIAAPPPRSTLPARTTILLAASAGGFVIVALLLVLALRGDPSSAAAAGPSASVTMGPQAAPNPAPAEPAPIVSSGATPTATAAPAESAAPPGSASAAPFTMGPQAAPNPAPAEPAQAPVKPPKKRIPNFGY
jgi:serine/threonine-protein kinase